VAMQLDMLNDAMSNRPFELDRQRGGEA
jgi:hypothetical protein